MKDFKRDNKHKRDCWYREDDSDPRVWYLNTYEGVKHFSIRNEQFISMDCNCPGCPARLRVALRLVEDFIVRGWQASLPTQSSDRGEGG